jgi:hypothetical protein
VLIEIPLCPPVPHMPERSKRGWAAEGNGAEGAVGFQPSPSVGDLQVEHGRDGDLGGHRVAATADSSKPGVIER